MFSTFNAMGFTMFGAVMVCSAVITVLLVTTCLTSLVIIICWHKSIILAIFFLVFFGSIEALNFSASLIKFLEGAWAPMFIFLIFNDDHVCVELWDNKDV